MTTYYLDTSALIKHYHVEVGTPVVDEILSEPDASHFLSRLAGVEMQSAFAKRVRMRVLTESDFERFCRKFLADITNAQYRVVRLLVRHFQLAEQLMCVAITESTTSSALIPTSAKLRRQKDSP
ncbi:TPA: hypothetical protein EYP66_15240 [Candidatus Poribacteria bacterium]|nr:hypothetical protein [Candidatus Poribacteria bacterium]